jgi:hypothetical protein
MRVKIVATPTTGRRLRPGDLFSTHGPEYWDGFVYSGSIGECVYVRTNAVAHLLADQEARIYRIKVVRSV